MEIIGFYFYLSCMEYQVPAVIFLFLWCHTTRQRMQEQNAVSCCCPHSFHMLNTDQAPFIDNEAQKRYAKFYQNMILPVIINIDIDH